MLTEEEKASLRKDVEKEFEREKEQKRLRAKLEKAEKSKARKASLLRISIAVCAFFIWAWSAGLFEDRGTFGTSGGQTEAELAQSEKAYVQCRTSGLTEDMCYEYSMDVTYRGNDESLSRLRALCANSEYHVHYGGLAPCVNAVNEFINRLR